MARVALMRVAAIRPVRRFLRRIGSPVDQLLERLHLPVDLMDDPERLMPAYLGSLFVAEAARSAGIETLGALAGEDTQLDDLGSFGHQLLQATTLHDLILTAQRIGPSFNSGEEFWLAGTPTHALFCHRYTIRLDDQHLQSDQYALLIPLAFFRTLAGPTWRPTIYLRKGIPRAIGETSLLRDAEIVFDQPVCAISVPPALLHLPLSMLNRATVSTPVDVTDWHSSRPAADIATSLRQWMTSAIRTDAVRIDIMSETIGATPRTLQRRLAEVGTTYARLLGQARFEMATRLLGRDDLAIRDVAYEVGYRDAAHLTRAFQRWSGTTPSHFRRLQRALDADGAGRCDALAMP